MESIAATFTKGNFRFRQVERYGELAIYEQTHAHGPMVRYEVVRIRVCPAQVILSGSRLPEREVYPSSSSWGKDGFTTYTLAEARELLGPWLARVEAAPDTGPGAEVPVF